MTKKRSEPMNIAILDDEKEITSSIKEMLNDLNPEYNVDTFNDEKQLKKELETKEYTIMFIDIKLKESNGINFVKECINNLKDTNTVYISGYDEYIEDTFETDFIYYLRKPINKDKLTKVINKVKKNLEDNKKYIIFNKNNSKEKIYLKDINYLESTGRLLKVYLNNEVKIYYSKISDIEKKLGPNFLRIHKSFCVNLEKVKTYKTNKVTLIDDKELPISRTYSNICKKIVFEFLKSED